MAVRDIRIKGGGFSPPGLRKLSTSSNVDVRFLAGSRGCAGHNNNSLVLRIEYKGIKAILTVDAEVERNQWSVVEVGR